MDSWKISPWGEHQFWLKILEDHAHFVHDFLAPEEKKFIKQAARYIQHFQILRKELETINPQEGVNSPNLIGFSQKVYPIAEGYYQFEGFLQHLRLQNKVNLNLTPTYLNGTTNENEEYLRILSFYIQGEEAPMLPLTDLLELWLDDQLGHVLLLNHGVDPVEAQIVEETNRLAQIFRSFIIRNEQYAGYLRFTKPLFPAQIQFVEEIIQAVVAFNQLVTKTIVEFKKDQLVSRLTLRFLEHHLPETCYFLRKLTCYLPDQVSIPNCQLHPPYFPNQSN